MSEQSVELSPGLRGQAAIEVTDDVTAERVGSGTVPVLATPEVLALVERAAVAALEGALPEGSTTVGVHVELEHLAPTPVGGTARATAVLDEANGRRLAFSFEVSDAAGPVARGTHRRAVVDRDRFLGSAEARR